MKIKVEEGYAVLLSFIYFFCVLGAYYVLRPIRDQLAVKLGSAELTWFFAATFLATLILTPIFSWLISRWPRRLILPFVYLFFIGCQVVFICLFNHHDLLPLRTLGLVFFVYVSVFNLFVVSVFWSFMTDIWSDVQARRLFPIIALGGAVGAILGPIMTSLFVNTMGLSFLLLASAALLFAAVICILLLGKWANRYGTHRFETNNAEAIEGGMLDGLKQIFTHPFISKISLMMLLSDNIGTIAYVLVLDYSGAAFPNDMVAQTRFAAHMDLSANILQIVTQLTVTRWLLIRYGAASVFLVCSIIIMFTCLATGLANNPYAPILSVMPPVAIMMIITRALSHGMILPARETLYTLVSRSVRYKGKNAVDTVIWRGGDIVSMLSINAFHSLGLNMAVFGMIWAALATGTGGFIGWRLANRVEKGEFKES
ncbi:MAG: NTP/NDP exchange transporter [Parachlamydiaceae bacterium]